MFDPSLVVSSAASSFNNAAIAAPYFFWAGLLMLPLFVLTFRYGNDFINNLGWIELRNPMHRAFNFSFITEVLICLWIILMHGSYDVLRDSSSVLPFAISGILFLVTASMVWKLRTINPPMPEFLKKYKYRYLIIAVLMALIAIAAGFSGMPTIWGFFMNSAAVVCGALVGRSWMKGFSPVSMTTFIIFALVLLVLMQPEFFRYGQLGNLTAIHMMFIIFAGMLAMAVLALRWVKPRGKIYNSAFVKLKIMMRIIIALSIIIFALTESVPVFLGFAAAVLISFAMSVWHAKSVPENLSDVLWSVLLCVFGIMIFMPLITAIGIVRLADLPFANAWRQAKFLL